MNERANANDLVNDIRPGMPVYTIDGKQLGPVEAVDEDRCIRVHTHTVPPAAIERVDRDGIHLRLAQAAFAAAPPMTREAAGPAES